jgi:hypothetical protein
MICDFVIVRSGDGAEFKFGEGTLEQGEELIKKYDDMVDFIENISDPFDREVMEYWEGGDAYAVSDQGWFIYTGHWEAYP